MDCAPTLRALDEKKFELEVESDTIEQLTSLLQEQLHRLQARTPPPPLLPTHTTHPPAAELSAACPITAGFFVRADRGEPADQAARGRSGGACPCPRPGHPTPC